MRRQALDNARRTVDDQRRQAIAEARLHANEILVSREEESFIAYGVRSRRRFEARGRSRTDAFLCVA